MWYKIGSNPIKNKAHLSLIISISKHWMPFCLHIDRSAPIMANFADICWPSSVRVHYVYAPCCQTEIAQVSKHTASKVLTLSRCLCANKAAQTFSHTRKTGKQDNPRGLETSVDNILLSLKLTGNEQSWAASK